MSFDCPICGYTSDEDPSNFECSCGYSNIKKYKNEFNPNSQHIINFSRRKLIYVLLLNFILIFIPVTYVFVINKSIIHTSLAILLLIFLLIVFIKYINAVINHKYAIKIDLNSIKFNEFYNYKEIPLNCIISIQLRHSIVRGVIRPYIAIQTNNNMFYIKSMPFLKFLYKFDDFLGLVSIITIRGNILEIPLEDVYRCLNDYLTYAKSITNQSANSNGSHIFHNL